MATADLGEERDLTATSFHGTPVYTDGDGRMFPTCTGVIDRLKSKGRIRPPLYSTDGVTRTTGRPDVVRWYTARVGELVHERIAARVDADYDADVEGVVRRVHQCDGVEASHDEIRGVIHDYRGTGSIRSRILDQVEEDAASLLEGWEKWWSPRRWEVIGAERRLVGKGRAHGERVRYGVRPDVLARDTYENETVALCLKATSRITNAHQMQAVATLRAHNRINRAVIVRLDREYSSYYTEEVGEEDIHDEEWAGRYVAFLEGVLRVSRGLN